SLQTIGLKKVNATVATVILSLESVFGVLFSILLYHEQVTVRMGIGFAVVFVAVLISQMEISPEKDTVS
ncbi:MAG: EamA family transporter, partial [Anaerotignum sp.]|nr:EamA family transporter [Anaerotignum sp.]